MRILAVSDIEEAVLYEASKQARLMPVDCIISCGDLHEDYLSYLSTTYEAPLFMVRGNHDTAISVSSAGLFGWLPDFGDWWGDQGTGVSIGENLHRHPINYQGIRMLGFEGAPRYTQDAVQYSEWEMSLMVAGSCLRAKLTGGADIVVTHTPPKGIHDEKDYAHRGFPAFNHLIHWLKPRFLLHGHTHLNYNHDQVRITQVESTKVINVYGYHLLEL